MVHVSPELARIAYKLDLDVYAGGYQNFIYSIHQIKDSDNNLFVDKDDFEEDFWRVYQSNSSKNIMHIQLTSDKESFNFTYHDATCNEIDGGNFEKETDHINTAFFQIAYFLGLNPFDFQQII